VGDEFGNDTVAYSDLQVSSQFVTFLKTRALASCICVLGYLRIFSHASVQRHRAPFVHMHHRRSVQGGTLGSDIIGNGSSFVVITLHQRWIRLTRTVIYQIVLLTYLQTAVRRGGKPDWEIFYMCESFRGAIRARTSPLFLSCSCLENLPSIILHPARIGVWAGGPCCYCSMHTSPKHVSLLPTPPVGDDSSQATQRGRAVRI
jgi:hypothetical protein